jgi:xeroderma pigmentosum group C-complementing protein
MDQMSSNAVDSDDDFDWEEVQVPEHQHNLEITLQTSSKPDSKSTNKFVVILNNLQDSFLILVRKKGIPHAERLLRVDCHKIHTVALIVNARIRNKWINDPLLHVGGLYKQSEGAIL